MSQTKCLAWEVPYVIGREHGKLGEMIATSVLTRVLQGKLDELDTVTIEREVSDSKYPNARYVTYTVRGPNNEEFGASGWVHADLGTPISLKIR